MPEEMPDIECIALQSRQMQRTCKCIFIAYNTERKKEEKD